MLQSFFSPTTFSSQGMNAQKEEYPVCALINRLKAIHRTIGDPCQITSTFFMFLFSFLFPSLRFFIFIFLILTVVANALVNVDYSNV